MLCECVASTLYSPPFSLDAITIACRKHGFRVVAHRLATARRLTGSFRHGCANTGRLGTGTEGISVLHCRSTYTVANTAKGLPTRTSHSIGEFHEKYGQEVLPNVDVCGIITACAMIYVAFNTRILPGSLVAFLVLTSTCTHAAPSLDPGPTYGKDYSGSCIRNPFKCSQESLPQGHLLHPFLHSVCCCPAFLRRWGLQCHELAIAELNVTQPLVRRRG